MRAARYYRGGRICCCRQGEQKLGFHKPALRDDCRVIRAQQQAHPTDWTAVADAVAFSIGRGSPVYRAAMEAASAIPGAEERFMLHLENVEDGLRDAFAVRLSSIGQPQIAR